MRKLSKDTVTSLVVCYHAYHEANDKGDYSGIVCWGPMLIRAMERTGVEMCGAHNIERNVDYAKVRIAERKAPMDDNARAHADRFAPVP